MLTLTAPAVEAIRGLTRQPGLPDDTGLRITPHGDDADSVVLAISGPEAEDEVIETEGVRVFLQSEAAIMLDDKALDAQVGDEGVTFRIGSQPQ